MPKNLIVPGTSGNKLLNNGQDIGWPGALTAQAWLAGARGFAPGLDGAQLSAEQLVQLLSMEYANPDSIHPTKTTLTPGGAITPGALLGLAYNQFKEYDSFLYDFRSDIRASGDRLLEKLKTEKPPNDRWRIVCHSQGGLVVVAASKLYAQENGGDDRAFARLVSHVCFVGVPFYGAINSADAFITGNNLTPSFRDGFRKLVRTWPSIHQMLPVWPGCVQLATSNGTSKAPFDMMDPRAWPNQDLSPAMLARARATRKEVLNNPLSRMNDVKTLILMSRAYSTWNHVVVSNNQVQIPEPSEPGDTLVPAETTYNIAAEVEQRRMLLLGKEGNTLSHFVLANDPVVFAHVEQFFGQ